MVTLVEARLAVAESDVRVDAHDLVVRLYAAEQRCRCGRRIRHLLVRVVSLMKKITRPTKFRRIITEWSFNSIKSFRPTLTLSRPT